MSTEMNMASIISVFPSQLKGDPPIGVYDSPTFHAKRRKKLGILKLLKSQLNSSTDEGITQTGKPIEDRQMEEATIPGLKISSDNLSEKMTASMTNTANDEEFTMTPTQTAARHRISHPISPRTPRIPKPGSIREIKFSEGRIEITDEIPDCIYPFGSGDTKTIVEDAPTLTTVYRDKFNDKRVLSSPSFNVGSVSVRAEEIGLVLVILLLWAGAISLFINRWGKLRMLEPYQPAYTAPESSPPPGPRPGTQPPPLININIQSTSSPSLNEGYRRSSSPDWGSNQNHEVSDHYDTRMQSSRCHFGSHTFSGTGTTQSMSLGVEKSPYPLLMAPLTPQRKVRSAVDLVSLVMQEKLTQSPRIPFAATNV